MRPVEYEVYGSELDPPELYHRACGLFVYSPDNTPTLNDLLEAALEHQKECRGPQ